MEKVGKILVLASTLLLCACVTDFQSVVPPVALTLTVQNESGTMLKGADVFVFDKVSAFNQSVSSGTPAGFVSTEKSIDGIVQFDHLAANTSYYLYAVYKDTALIPGTYITYDNSEEKYSLKNALAPGSITSLQIVLKPADGLITFWTSPGNNGVLPITVYGSASSLGNVSQSYSSVPSLFAPGTFTVRAKKGTIALEGKSAAGCLWINNFIVTGAQSVFYKLDDCIVGSVGFYTDNSNTTKLPITLQLNANDVLPNMTFGASTVPLACSDVNVFSSVRVPGIYTYQAVSPSGNCLWSGSFTIAQNSCTLIALPTCP